MMPNRRERILMFVVAAVACGYGMLLAAKRVFLDPLDFQAAQTRTLQTDIATNNQRIQEALTARARLEEWQAMSLPPEEHAAQSLYQEFLFKLVQACHVEDGVVTAAQTQRGKYFTRIPFTITGKSTLEDFTDFLYRFYRPNLLHQVRTVSLRRPRQAAGNLLEFNLSVEGLSLFSAPPRTEPLPDGRDSSGPLRTGSQHEDFAIISRKNIFQPFRELPKAAPSIQRAIDAAGQIYLTGVTAVGDHQQAWLYDRRTNENLPIRVGEQVDVAGVKGRIACVTHSGILLVIDDRLWSLKLGRNLREMRELAASEPSSASDTESSEEARESTESHPK